MTAENPALQESREEALGRMTDAVFALDEDWRVTYLNDHAEELLGAESSELLGEALWDAFPEARGTTFYREYRRAVSEQHPVSFEEYYDPLDAWFSVRAFPSETGLTVYFRDVTEEHERRVELERGQKRLAVRDRLDEVLTDVVKLGTTVASLSEFESSLVDRLHRVDGVHAVRMDRVDVSADSTELVHSAGPLEFDASAPNGLVDAVETREVTHVTISETPVERFDSVSRALVFVPLVTADESRGGLTLAVGSVFDEQVAQSAFEHLSDTVEFVVETLCSREKWRSVAEAFEQIDAGAYVVDADGTIVWANESFAEYVGIDSLEIVDSDHELFVERRLDPIFDGRCDITSYLVDSEIATDHSESSDTVARISAGYDRDERVLEHDARPLQAGRFAGGTVHVFTDITDQQSAKKSLAETEWVRSSLLDTFPGMAYRCRNTKQWEMEYVAGRIESLTGYTADEVRTSISWGETIVDPRDRDTVWTEIQSQLEDGDSFELSYRIVCRDGTTRWVWERGRRVETSDGERLAGFILDVTEKREVKDQLRLEEGRFQSLVEHVSEYAIFTVNRDGCIESWNDGAKCITGFSVDEAIGMRLSALVPDDQDDRYLSASNMTEAVMRGESHAEGWIQTNDGESFWARVVLRAITGDDDEVRGFVAVVRDMTEQRQRRRELEHQRDELVTLNRINAVIRDIDRALVQARSRQEICEAICERLTDDDRYELAWIGESDPSRNVVRPIEWDGTEGEYVENLDVSIEGDRGGGPVGQSLRTDSVAVTQRISDDPEFEPWRERALEHGLHSSASVPIEYGGIPYGTLCVYSRDAEAFDERETQLLAELGEMVGYAFNAVDRKQALVADSMTEITFELSDGLEGITGLTSVTDGRITLTSTVRTNDETFLQYLRTEGVDPSEVEAVLETNELVRSVEVLWSDGTNGSLSVTSDSSPFTQAVSVYGGRLGEVVAEDGVVTANVRFPKGANIHAVTDQLRSEYPGIEVKAKREIRPENEAQRLAELVADELTDRQAEVLKTAYHSGYYEWPRDTNGTELSDRLDLSAATLSQHLRAAHDTVVGSVVEHRLQ
ncbi:PAS domain S-box protein [Haloferax sp. DFSO52]|uniref:PAS domain S-box protein n=1 Tax=Haloferax sp. DFSO52 TaxID=3388505 RepID=UPI003A8C1CCE